MDLLIPALQANAIFAALYLIYRIALRQETWFGLRRAWLIGAATLALVLPFMPRTAVVGPVLHFELPVAFVQASTTPEQGFEWPHILLYIHLVVTGVLLVRLLVRFALALRCMRRPVREASSFLGMVRVPDGIDAEATRAMQKHERVHARQWHSFDVLFFELLAAVCWSNPFWWLALREIRLVHEHIADAEAATAHHAYDELLLANALNIPTHTLSHRFNSSNLKKRIAMLHNTRSPRHARPKLLLIIPALALGLVLSSWNASSTPTAETALLTASTEQQPTFPGGQEALMKYLGENITYPKAAQDAKAEGNVIIGFVVRADGSIGDVDVKRGIHDALDAEALRVISAMPAWEPARKDGKAVAAQMTLPIAFRLSSEE